MTDQKFWQTQPHAIVERDGVTYTLLGTAHVSQASVEAVHSAIDSGAFDAVAVELDAQRWTALSNPNALANVDLLKVIREGKTALFAANLGLAAYQRRLAEQLGIEPGAELKAAMHAAQARQLPTHLIDRDVGITFKRTSQAMGFWQRCKIMAGIFTSLFFDEKVEDEAIEKLKEGDMLEASFSEFASASPELYQGVIAERDAYMAAQLRQHAGNTKQVLAVIGAGHLQGTTEHLQRSDADPASTIAGLETLKPKSSIPWFTIILATLVIGGFVWGFASGGVDVGRDMLLAWVLITAGLGALGCALAGGHPLSILAAALSSPITPLHPALASGMVSGLTETWLRKPKHSDFMALRDDVQQIPRGWYRNRVSRILLVFMLTNLGTALGVWLGGAQMVRRFLAG